jgi:hypothetical protein
VSNTAHHGRKAKERLFTEGKRRFEGWHWMRVEPKEWRKLTKHRKRRAAVRQALRKDFDATAFPLDKKPHIYYY